jgi:glycosyltransferase involved in cell wall biosynthesis
MGSSIDVLIACYNEEPTIEKVILEHLEVLRNSKVFDQFQITVLDDGSTDNSWSVIEDLNQQFPSVKGIRFRRNYGKSAALHSAFQKVARAVIFASLFSVNDISGKISNIIMSVNNYAFYTGTSLTGIISYVKANGPIYTINELKGKLINCELNCIGKSVPVINNVSGNGGAIIERCKLLSDNVGAGTIRGSTVTAQILYTITNYGISGTITNTVTGVSNRNSDFTTAN